MARITSTALSSDASGSIDRILGDTRAARTRLIATDGVFSMDGDIAPLAEICALGERHDALVMVDDSHATGFFGPTERGMPEHCAVAECVDIITSTLGKALGGASGGFTAARGEIVDLLRQRSRPYLFSNTLPPALVSASLACLELLSGTSAYRGGLATNTRWFRRAMTEAGFQIRAEEHPIVPIRLGDAHLAHQMAADLLAAGIYVVGFSHPVVSEGQARIRVQISGARGSSCRSRARMPPDPRTLWARQHPRPRAWARWARAGEPPGVRPCVLATSTALVKAASEAREKSEGWRMRRMRLNVRILS